MALLEAANLSKRYGDTLALDRLNLAVDGGEIVCLLGANGAGKTTAVNLFLGFVEPSEGQALVDGQDVLHDLAQARRKIAYVPEQVALYPQLSGVENLAFFAEISGFHYGHDALLGFLQEAGLAADAARRRVQGYSKGMQQKVAVAIALAKQARILILDEPTSGLDPAATHEFYGTVEKLRDQGAAILMVSHDLFNTQALADRVCIMRQGRVRQTLAGDALRGADLKRLYLEHMDA